DDDAPAWVLGAGILLAVLAPIVARLVQLGISRKREYLADAAGAKMTRYPDGLANALTKIQEENQGMDVNRSVRALYISAPVKEAGKRLMSTHPPLEERIQRLREM
ncbi:MAG: M48 family metalloprotease, partial [Candidatus Nanohaloarchaea archaeon]|nr:M48 family metalloprotease [Candidatus Nanohaloarchaea archaeon]